MTRLPAPSLVPGRRRLRRAAAVVAAILTAAPAFAGPPATSPRPVLRGDAPQAAQVAAATPTTAAPEQTRPAGGYVRVWKAGDDIYSYNFHLLTAYHRYGLPTPPQGQAYVQLGNQVLRVDLNDWRVVAPVGRTFALLGRHQPAPRAKSRAPILEASM